jgi:adenosylmethionine-8-amino-7-oxononanoate aminotransferase
VACAAALAVQRVIERDGLLAPCSSRARCSSAGCASLRRTSPCRRHPRPRPVLGHRTGADRADKTPFDPALKLHAQVKKQGMARGLMVYPMGGTVDGVHGDHVLLAPPFIVSEADLDRIVERLAASRRRRHRRNRRNQGLDPEPAPDGWPVGPALCASPNGAIHSGPFVTLHTDPP